MVRLFIALLCAQPSADVVSVLYIEPGTRVELALTNTSDRPLSFVVREDGTVYGTEFGLIHNGETVEKVRSMVIQGPLASKEIQPGESLPCWMSTSYFYHSVLAANVDDSPQAPSLPRRGRRPRTIKQITTGRYELIGSYRQGREQVREQAVTPLELPSRRLAILEVGGSFVFNRDQEVYPVQSIVREEAAIELLPVIRVSPEGRLEFALANTSDQPLTFLQHHAGNSIAGLEYTLLQDGEPLAAAETQHRPPYLAQVVAPGEALRLVTSPVHFVTGPEPGRYELVVSYKMGDGQVDADGVAATPFEMPARVVAILEIGDFRRDSPKEP